ncbi:hypothetical protein [Reinekea sp.]|uniref:hypothetical protein n=1 Tax=Reinekea sp. TaxID=1970455 RepID=UPI003989674C
MTETELLEKALHSSASIHQPHALKAFIAAQYLSVTLPDCDGLWLQVSELISKSELSVTGSISEMVEAPEFSEVRISRILSGGIYPAAYLALAQWYERKGFEDIFAHYIAEAASHSEYLSHNVTILLALNTVYQQLTVAQTTPFLNRMTEFLTSTFERNSSVVPSNPVKAPSFSELLEVSIKQPSFFGHNLITLAWLIRCEAMLNSEQLSKMSYHLYLQATSPLDDPDDALDITILNGIELISSEDEFHKKLSALIFDTCDNLHQVTLADALVYLQQQFPAKTANLSLIADYYHQWLKS